MSPRLIQVHICQVPQLTFNQCGSWNLTRCTWTKLNCMCNVQQKRQVNLEVTCHSTLLDKANIKSFKSKQQDWLTFNERQYTSETKLNGKGRQIFVSLSKFKAGNCWRVLHGLRQRQLVSITLNKHFCNEYFFIKDEHVFIKKINIHCNLTCAVGIIHENYDFSLI